MEEIKQLLVPIEEEGKTIGTFVVDYDGVKDGAITVSSTFNYRNKHEGLDIVQEILLQDEEDAISIPITLLQEGRREVFKCSDFKYGPPLDFIPADGGTFNVLKEI